MVSRGDLRDDSAEFGMNLRLAENFVGQHPVEAFKHGCGGFVTRGFDRQDAHGVFAFPA